MQDYKLSELGALKGALEGKLLQGINALLTDFQNETGLGVDAIKSDFVEVTTLGSASRTFRISRIEVSISTPQLQIQNKQEESNG